MRRISAVTCLLGLVVAACWGVSRTPPAAPAPSPSAKSPAAPTSATSPLAPTPTPATLDLRDFTPLLLEPRFAAARAFVENGEKEAGARSLLAVAALEKTDVTFVARTRFLAARLFVEAGQKPAAIEAYRAAAETPWLLAEDARVRLATLLVDAKRPAEALEVLAGAPGLAEEDATRLTRARALAGLERFAEADGEFSALLARTATSDVRIERAIVQVTQGEKTTDAEVRRRAGEAARLELGRALVGLPKTHPLVVASKGLEARLVALGLGVPTRPSEEERLAHLSGLVDRNALEEAREFAATFSFDAGDESLLRCQFDYVLSKLLALDRKWGEAADRLAATVTRCASDPALHAKILFNAGKFAAADGRDARAVTYFAELEDKYPKDTLADDARLRRARSYKDMGAPARFVDLLARMPEDYPEGDMTMEGVLELALHRIERKDWPGAALVLERAVAVVRSRDAARGHEFAGCERYFLARALGEQGKFREELDEYEGIVRELPLSYYMLHAYSRLKEADPARARDALERGRVEARERPFSFPYRPAFGERAFQRALELLRLSDLEEGQRVLASVRGGAESDEALLWGIALLSDRAGDAHVSHSIARGKLTDWLAHYPSGDWERPWQIGFPRPYRHIVEKESQSTGVPAWFIYGIMREESTFDPEAESPAAAYGLMQLIVPTARVIGKKAGLPYSPGALKEPRVNIALGSRVLASLVKQFPENPWLAIPGYNAGPGRPRRWLRERPDVDFDVWVEMIPYRETRRYTKRVLASRAAYAFLYHPADVEGALVLPRRLTLP